LLTSCSKLPVFKVTICSFAMDVLRLVSGSLDAAQGYFDSGSLHESQVSQSTRHDKR
jgi:hypothetical protein